jgi:hypothetical protein
MLVDDNVDPRKGVLPFLGLNTRENDREYQHGRKKLSHVEIWFTSMLFCNEIHGFEGNDI